jgi:outer membrane protein assembly factor BamB
MVRGFRALAAVFVIIFSLPAEDWTRFRGPNGSGVSSATGFPTEFGADKNLIWRTPVRSGKSSPVLTERHIFLTSSGDGELFTECFDRKTGKLLWERSQKQASNEMANNLNHPAAATAVTDGENVYAFFKDFGLLSYDSAGNLRWKVPLIPFVSAMGLGGSPIIARNFVILQVDQLEGSYIAAFDRRNGEMRWKSPRNETEGWGTPLLYERAGADPLVLTVSRGQFGAYVLANGKRTATQEGLPTTIVGSPILAQNTIFAFGYGSETPDPFANRLKRYDKNHDGQLSPDEYGTDAFVHGIAKYRGNRDMIVTKEEWDEKQREVMGPNGMVALRVEAGPDRSIQSRELWRYNKSFTGVIPSALLYQGILYVVRNGGILTAFDSETGEVLKAGRLEGALGGYSSSPVAADGKIYLASEEGKVTVVRAGRDWDILARNDLGEDAFSTPALSSGRIYLRTSEALYCFGIVR